MCLVTNTPIPTILDKDLVVYKVLYKWYGCIYSIYQDYRYDVGKIYHDEEIGMEPVDEDQILEYCVFEAYHACTTLERANYHLGEGHRIYKCVIPKGSKVFFDKIG